MKAAIKTQQGDWTYEIAKMVEHQDINKIFTTIENVIKQLKTIR
jgi:hypothetical protein